ncbi:MAG: hypothetical protein CMJ47_13040 [Planctomyces sp.]|nr:hypothetical protein [Planctomyces sp.]
MNLPATIAQLDHRTEAYVCHGFITEQERAGLIFQFLLHDRRRTLPAWNLRNEAQRINSE